MAQYGSALVDDQAEPLADRRARIDFGLPTALAVVAAVGAAVIVGNFVGAASQPIGWAVACAVVAALLRPLLGFFDRHLPHLVAIVLTLLTVALLLGGAWVGVLNTIADNVSALKRDAPAAAANIELDNEAARDFKLEERVTAFVEDLDEQAGTTAQLRQSTSTLSTYVVTGVLVLFFIGYGNRLVTGALGQVDESRRDRVQRIGGRAVKNWRGYIYVLLVQMFAITMIFWLALWAIDLPAPFVLALTIGVLSLVPLIGIMVGGLPALLFAMATAEPTKILPVLALLLAAQAFEAFFVRRRVDAATVHVGPALPLIVALIGWQLYGFGGALYGVILLVLLLAVTDAVRIEQDQATNSPKFRPDGPESDPLSG
jgi:predicted PurR-regulated permease PerM